MTQGRKWIFGNCVAIELDGGRVGVDTNESIDGGGEVVATGPSDEGVEAVANRALYDGGWSGVLY